MKHRLLVLATVTAATVAGLSYKGEPALELIQRHEGKVNSAYADPAHGWAVPTICAGHTRTARRGMWLSDQQCMDLLQEDIKVAIRDLQSLVGRDARLTEGELLAYTSFVFNVGPTKLRSSTWLRKFNAGDRAGACRELTRWVFANGVKLRGLEKRRAEERAICLRDL
jgi:lysozyme